MTSLNDILFRLAPADVDGLAAQWEFDTAGDWIEVTGWFSPGAKFGEPRYDVPFKHRASGDYRTAMRECVEAIVSQVRKRMAPAIEKRKPGRPARKNAA